MFNRANLLCNISTVMTIIQAQKSIQDLVVKVVPTKITLERPNLRFPKRNNHI